MTRSQAKLSAVAAEMATMKVPSPLEVTVARHQADLLALSEQLIKAGVDDAVIETSISVLFERFKGEMVRTIAKLRGGE